MAKKKMKTGTKLLIAGAVIGGGYLLYKVLKPSPAVVYVPTGSAAAPAASNPLGLAQLIPLFGSIKDLFSSSGSTAAPASNSTAIWAGDPTSYGDYSGLAGVRKRPAMYHPR